MDLKPFEESRPVDQELVDAGAAYEALTQMPGWERLLAAVKNRMVVVGLRGHFDTAPEGPGYWAGYLDGMERTLAIPASAIEEANKVLEKRLVETQAAMPLPKLDELEPEERAFIRPLKSEDEL